MPSLPFQTVLGSVLLAATVILSQAEPAPATLKDAYKDYFKIGTAINRSVATGRSGRRSEAQVAADVALVKAQFNHVVAENEMKWSSLHPRAGKDGYDWQAADDFVEFGTKNRWSWPGTRWCGTARFPTGCLKARSCRLEPVPNPGKTMRPKPPTAHATCGPSARRRPPSRRWSRWIRRFPAVQSGRTAGFP
jgi:hypothetical protein